MISNTSFARNLIRVKFLKHQISFRNIYFCGLSPSSLYFFLLFEVQPIYLANSHIILQLNGRTGSNPAEPNYAHVNVTEHPSSVNPSCQRPASLVRFV